eukprot:scpid6412/ scgid16952/ 
MEDDSGVAPVRVTFEQLKAAARKLERLDGNSRKDLEERRTPAGRGRQSAVQAELRAMSATKNSRVLSSCSALSRAVQDAVTASTTSSRKELSIEEQRELNARRKMAAKGELALHERTTSSLDEDRRRNQQAKASSGGTHGVLGRTGSVDAAAGLSHARSPPTVDSSRVKKTKCFRQHPRFDTCRYTAAQIDGPGSVAGRWACCHLGPGVLAGAARPPARAGQRR